MRPSRTSGTRSRGTPLRVEADADTEVEIDPRLASVALSHVLENAAQYSPADREIVVDARASTATACTSSVTDQRPGLDPGELEHLFERFYRGRAARQATFGTGMGLAITRGLLAAAGGRVWAENVPGARRHVHDRRARAGARRPRWRRSHGRRASSSSTTSRTSWHGGAAAAGARLRGAHGDDRPRGARSGRARQAGSDRARSRPAGYRRRRGLRG